MAFAEGYVEVAERIAEWYKRHPEGRIVTELVEFTDSRVTVKASAFRTSDPSEPPAGVGHSFLAIPGKTPYTKESELENAETSAAGRALVFAGIPSKNVASSNEVRAKSTQRPTLRAASAGGEPPSPPAPVQQATKDTGETTRGAPAGSQAGGAGVVGEGGTGSPACPDCGESEFTIVGLSDGQLKRGFVKCVAGTCGRVYVREA